MKKDTKKEIIEFIEDIVLAVVAAIIILQFIGPVVVQQHSMENTLFNNDYLFVSKQSYKLFGKSPAYGDIVVFHSELSTEEGSEKLLIKRVIAVPGDKIAITGGVVYLNGEALDEPYTKDGHTDTEYPETEVPEGCLFCMGDNRQNSADSRDSRIGMVPIDSLVGKAVFRLYPFESFGKIR